MCLRNVSNISEISNSDISPAKARRTPSSDKYYFFVLAAFASLREIFRFFGCGLAAPRFFVVDVGLMRLGGKEL
jgi:hypothetical protein